MRTSASQDGMLRKRSVYSFAVAVLILITGFWGGFAVADPILIANDESRMTLKSEKFQISKVRRIETINSSVEQGHLNVVSGATGFILLTHLNNTGAYCGYGSEEVNRLFEPEGWLEKVFIQHGAGKFKNIVSNVSRVRRSLYAHHISLKGPSSECSAAAAFTKPPTGGECMFGGAQFAIIFLCNSVDAGGVEVLENDTLQALAELRTDQKIKNLIYKKGKKKQIRKKSEKDYIDEIFYGLNTGLRPIGIYTSFSVP